MLKSGLQYVLLLSHSCRLFDAVEADPGGRRGDGHGSCHSHTKGVVVLPAMPSLPYCRTNLREQKRNSNIGEIECKERNATALSVDLDFFP